MQSRRGRPQEAEPDRVVRASLRLFEKKGFDAVTMDDIADAAGVSRRTLFRLFPAKADLLWHGLNDFRLAIKASAAPFADKGLAPSEVVQRVFLPVLRALEPTEAAELARRKLRLLASAPALLNHETLRDIEEVIAGVIAPAAKVPKSLAARSLVAVTFAALLWWAEQDSELTALEATLGALDAVSTGRPRRAK